MLTLKRPENYETRTLRPYQEAGVQKFKFSNGAFWAMQMRLGKSLAHLRWMMRYKGCKRNLIIAPKTVLLSWEEEFRKENITPIPLIEMTIRERKAVLNEGQQGWYLLSYAAVPYMKDAILGGSFDSITLDESTCIKSAATKTTKILLKASKTVKVRACLSGEPAPEDWGNVWTQMAFVNGGSWMGYDDFYTWERAHFRFFGFERVLPAAQMYLIKKQFHEDAHIVTRAQAGIKDEKIYTLLSDNMPEDQAKIYKHIETMWELPNEGAPDIDDMTNYGMVVINWLRRIAGGFLPRNDGTVTPIPCWKYEETVKIVHECSGSVVIWCAYTAELERLSQCLRDGGVFSRTINGSVEQAERREILHDFQSGKLKTLLCQTKCGQYGLDLSSADTAVYFSNHYSYELRSQSEERIFMPGKSTDLHVIDLITKGSTDEIIKENLREKRSDARLLLSRIKIAKDGNDN